MINSDGQIWEKMLAYLRANHPVICRKWFEELKPLGIAGGAMQLRAQSDLHRDYLRKQCTDAFSDAARGVSGQLISVRFLGPQDVATPAPADPKNVKPTVAKSVEPRPVVEPIPQPPSETKKYQRESLTINPDYCFDNFVVGPGNRLAHAAADAVAANPGRAYNPYFIHGGVGLGKTHLLQAICLRIVERNPALVIYYTSCEDFVTQFIDSVQSGQMNDFRYRFRDVDVLVIDDIHFLAKRERTQEEFFHTFNSLHQANKQIILSSDAAPEEIPDLENRLVSRFKWGLVAKIDPPCYETRVAILKTKARIRGLQLPDDVAEFVASKIDSNIRELEGLIGKLHILEAVHYRSIDLELAREALGDTGREVVAQPRVQVVIDIVCDFYRVNLRDLQSKNRQRSITQPRQICMFLLRRLTKLSLTEIGGYFGGRDHTTVMHAIKTVEESLADPDSAAVLKTLEERIRRSPGNV